MEKGRNRTGGSSVLVSSFISSLHPHLPRFLELLGPVIESGGIAREGSVLDVPLYPVVRVGHELVDPGVVLSDGERHPEEVECHGLHEVTKLHGVTMIDDEAVVDTQHGQRCTSTDLFDVALADMLDRYRSTPQEGPLRKFAESIIAGMESEGRSGALPKTIGKMRHLSGRLN